MRLLHLALLCIPPLALSGCGTYVPDLLNIYDARAEVPADSEKVQVQSLIEYVACDVITSVQKVLIQDEDVAASPAAKSIHQPAQLTWLKDWVAQLTFTLTVDEKSQFNPGVSVNQVWPSAVTTFAHHAAVTTPQSFSTGLAAAFSSDATRKETLALYIPLAQYTDEKSLNKARAILSSGQSCKIPNAFISSDLKFMDWLSDVTLGVYVHKGVLGDFRKDLLGAASGGKSAALSHQVTFIVIYGGGVTPSWKLVNFTGNTTTPFLNAQRTNTNDVIITLGPPAPPSAGNKGAPLALGTAAENMTLAALIGISVANQVSITQINISQ